jgi:hypothetical protein
MVAVGLSRVDRVDRVRYRTLFVFHEKSRGEPEMLTTGCRFGTARFSVSAILAIGTVLLGAGSLKAGDPWTVTNLHPEGALQSRALATTGTQQAGYRNVGDVERAVLWNGSAESWVNLHPGDGTDSQALATTGTQQPVGPSPDSSI